MRLEPNPLYFMSFNWIPGHADQKGNEDADRLAKRGAEMVTSRNIPVIPVSKSVITNDIEKWMRNEHTRVWTNRLDCRQSRLELPSTRQLEGHPNKRQR